MATNLRTTLKQMLNGSITGPTAAAQLQSALTGTSCILIVVEGTNGLYSIGSEHGLTASEMQARTKGTVHVIVDENTARLGDA